MKFVGRKRLSLPSTIGTPLPIRRTTKIKMKTTNNVGFKVTDFNTLTVHRKEDDYLG
jgi:hypothetical protein